MQYEKLKSEEINIWSMLSIFTYQQIAQRLTTMHSLGKPFRTFIAVYAHSVEGQGSEFYWSSSLIKEFSKNGIQVCSLKPKN